MGRGVERGPKKRDTGRKKRELEKVQGTVQPIWDVFRRQSVPEVADKADPIFVDCLKVPGEKMSFREGIKKCQQTVLDP